MATSWKFKIGPVAEAMEKLLGHKIKKLDGRNREKKSKKKSKKYEPGSIIMLENIRFYREEEKCDPQFSKTLASYAPLTDYFVMDAFGTTHRAILHTRGRGPYSCLCRAFLLEKGNARTVPSSGASGTVTHDCSRRRKNMVKNWNNKELCG